MAAASQSKVEASSEAAAPSSDTRDTNKQYHLNSLLEFPLIGRITLIPSYAEIISPPTPREYDCFAIRFPERLNSNLLSNTACEIKFRRYYSITRFADIMISYDIELPGNPTNCINTGDNLIYRLEYDGNGEFIFGYVYRKTKDGEENVLYIGPSFRGDGSLSIQFKPDGNTTFYMTIPETDFLAVSISRRAQEVFSRVTSALPQNLAAIGRDERKRMY